MIDVRRWWWFRPVRFGWVFFWRNVTLIFAGGSFSKSNFKSLNILALEKKKRWHFEDKEPCITRYSTVGFVTTKVRIQSNASSIPRQSNLAVLDRISPEKTGRDGNKLSTSPSACLQRVKSLVKASNIQQYPACCGPQINLNDWIVQIKIEQVDGTFFQLPCFRQLSRETFYTLAFLVRSLV